MSKSEQKLTAEQEAIRNAQNDARSLCPADLQERIALIYGLDVKQEEEKKAIKEAKEEVGAAEAMNALTNKRELPKDAITFLLKLRKKDPVIRARILGTVFGYADDFGWFFRDLFDLTAVGVGSADEPGETAGFDATSEGKRRRGAKAEQRTPEQMAASHTPAPTPAVPLDEAQRQLEAYRAANPPKRGAKPKELKALEAQVEAAKAAESGELPALPEAKPGEITSDLREGNAEAEDHLRNMATGGPVAPPAEEAAEAVPAEKPKRASRKKAEPAAAAPVAPPPPPPVDDEEDEDLPTISTAAPPRPDALGAAPSSYRLG